MVKRRWPDVLVITGGSHITLLIDDIAGDLRYGRDIDLFMPRHCETEFAALALELKRNGRLISDFGVRAGQGHVGTCTKSSKVSPLSIKGRSEGARADFEYLPLFDRASVVDYDPARVTIPMQLTRGCLYGRCTYCTYPAIERERDAMPDWPRAVRDISELVQRTGVNRISFKDSFFTPRSLRELAVQLKSHRIQIEWSATTLLNASLTPELLRVLYDSGCGTLEFGLESIDADGQALFDKSLDMAMVERVIKSATDAGIPVVLNQILGWPGQTQESADRQVEWYERIRADCPDLVFASFNLLEVNRKAPMSVTPEKYGIVLAGVAPWAFSYDWNAPAWRESWQIPLFDTEIMCAT